MSLKKIVEALKKFHSIIITTHCSVEADALTSELAMASLLRTFGKRVFIVNQDSVPPLYEFLPGVKSIMSLHKIKPNFKFDAAVILDCSNLDRIGGVKSLIYEDKPIINIDHHRANELFGSYNWVKPVASSAAEMIYEIFKATNIKINKQIATLLYAGIMTDTGSFRFENTTSATHRAVSDLLRFKIPIKDIYHKLYECFPVFEMRQFCSIIKDFKIDKSRRIAWLELRSGIIDERRTKIDLNDAAFHTLRSIDTVEVAIIFRESKAKDSVRVNLRSQGKVNVGQLAYAFGGGGHRAASGCVIKGNLAQVKNLVLNKLKKLL